MKVRVDTWVGSTEDLHPPDRDAPTIGELEWEPVKDLGPDDEIVRNDVHTITEEDSLIIRVDADGLVHLFRIRPA